MTKLEIDVADECVEPVLDCIVRHARTGAGYAGDGKIHVTRLEEAVRIADGARGRRVVTRSPLGESGAD